MSALVKKKRVDGKVLSSLTSVLDLQVSDDGVAGAAPQDAIGDLLSVDVVSGATPPAVGARAFLAGATPLNAVGLLALRVLARAAPLDTVGDGVLLAGAAALHAIRDWLSIDVVAGATPQDAIGDRLSVDVVAGATPLNTVRAGFRRVRYVDRLGYSARDSGW